MAICYALLGSLSGAAPAVLARQDSLEQRLDAVINTAVAEQRIAGTFGAFPNGVRDAVYATSE